MGNTDAEVQHFMLTLRENIFSRSFELMENMSAEIINSQDVCLFKETGLNATIRYELDARLAGMPKHRKVCHGDFNPSNIIITNENEAYILDWSHVTQGNASHDVMRTYLDFYLNDKIDLAEKYRNRFAEKTDTALQYLLKWTPIVAAEQLANGDENKDFLMRWIDVVEYE